MPQELIHAVDRYVQQHNIVIWISAVNRRSVEPVYRPGVSLRAGD